MIALCLVGLSCCGSQSATAPAPAPTTDYFDLVQCWRATGPGEPFRGAIAIYKVGSRSEAIVFSGQCIPGAALQQTAAAFNVRVKCIEGVKDLSHCRSDTEPSQPNEIFNPGVRPEFPDVLYAIEGNMLGPTTKDKKSIVFDRAQVVRYQKLPRELFGAFLFYQSDRPQYIRDYLTSRFYNEEGYKQLL
jgi:hypothetical protein